MAAWEKYQPRDAHLAGEASSSATLWAPWRFPQTSTWKSLGRMDMTPLGSMTPLNAFSSPTIPESLLTVDRTRSVIGRRLCRI